MKGRNALLRLIVLSAFICLPQACSKAPPQDGAVPAERKSSPPEPAEEAPLEEQEQGTPANQGVTEDGSGGEVGKTGIEAKDENKETNDAKGGPTPTAKDKQPDPVGGNQEGQLGTKRREVHPPKTKNAPKKPQTAPSEAEPQKSRDEDSKKKSPPADKGKKGYREEFGVE